jgi:hypothetical protein
MEATSKDNFVLGTRQNAQHKRHVMPMVNYCHLVEASGGTCTDSDYVGCSSVRTRRSWGASECSTGAVSFNIVGKRPRCFASAEWEWKQRLALWASDRFAPLPTGRNREACRCGGPRRDSTVRLHLCQLLVDVPNTRDALLGRRRAISRRATPTPRPRRFWRRTSESLLACRS